MREENFLELIDIYMDMVEKQDELIRRMGRIISKQAQTLQLIKNDKEFSNPKLDEEIAIMESVKSDYEDYMKS